MLLNHLAYQGHVVIHGEFMLMYGMLVEANIGIVGAH
jgi:hypothetical protein